MTTADDQQQKEDAPQTPAGPWIRLDRVEIEESERGYRVRIEGHNLFGSVAPPTVTVGGQRLTEPKFSRDGRSIEGVLRDKPENRTVTVDYGFARGEIEE
jgi:hypothetical protein